MSGSDRFERDEFPEEFTKFLPTPEELKGDLDWDAIGKKLAEGGGTTHHRILDENGEEKPATLFEWALWMEQGGRQITFDVIDDHEVSTIFMGLDHGHGHPLWYETIVFGPPRPTEIFGKIRPMRPSLWMERCETRAQAILMHEEGKKWLESYLQNERQNLQIRSPDAEDGPGERP